MFALYLKDERGDMIDSKPAHTYFDALKGAAAWTEEILPGYSVVIKDLAGLSDG